MSKHNFQTWLLGLAGLLATIVVPLRADAELFILSSVVTIGVPHTVDSWAAGVSDHGQIVGSSVAEGTLDLSGWSSNRALAFLMNVPGSSETVADDVNNRGDIVGAFVESGRTFGYIASSNGQFARLEVPGWEITYASGVNDRGQVVGHAINPGWSSAFLFEEGSYAILNIPGASSYGANDINNLGQVVGGYLDVDGRLSGYLYDQGNVTSLLFPGSEYTTAVAINDRSEIVGNYGGPRGNGTFLYCDGVFTEIETPSVAVSFFVSGINNSGRVVGQYNTRTETFAFSAELKAALHHDRPANHARSTRLR